MKPFSSVLFLAASLGLTLNLHAAVTVVDDWHMGESDLGIGSGDAAFSTLDSVGGDSLFNQPVGPAYPFYTNNVSAAAAFFAGSDLSIFYSGGQYGMASVIPNLTTNFGLELWVYPTASTSGAVVAYNGNTGSSGWGIYLSNGTNCMIFFGGMGFSSGAFVATNTWTDLALVCSNKLATLYINGVAASTLNKTPGSPSGSFLVAGDNSGLETFSGAVDEVRVFTFGSGQFSPTNLLVNGPLVVTTTADSGPGSLRGAVAAASPGNSIVTFTNTLSGQAITLASTLSLNASLTINASALPGGIQINGSNSVTVFNIASGTAPVLISLTITNGHSGYGGGIDNDNGTLILSECTLSGNSASTNGGGIYNNSGTLILDECTLSGNSCSFKGGGIFNEGTAILDLCTVSGNSAPGNSGEGGGIFNEGEQLTLNECTLSANNADEGGGFYNEVSITPPELNNTIIAGNSASNGADIYLSGSITYGGANLVQSENYNYIAVKGPDPLNAAPDLAPLGYYGGPTQTMPPLPGSPAIGAGSAAVNPFATDQRGYARTQNGLIDIGAVELPTVAPFTVSTNYGMVPLTVEFSSANNDSDGSAIVRWNWNFEDGTTGTGQSPIHVYSTGSAYLPALIVTNSLGLELGVSGPAVSVNPVIINNPADSGSGSLRVAITNEFGGEAITFAPNLSGQSITLGSTLQINTNLTIDASALPGGIKINGSNAVTVFNIASGVTDVLNSVTIANGYSSETGGGINNNGALTLNGCTLSGNRAADGGGIYNSSALMLNECTLSGNSAPGSGNQGGGIFNNNDSMAALNECTLSGNSAPGNSGEGGGIFNDGTLAITNTIDSQNSAFDGADIYSAGSPITYGGSNLVASVDYDGGAFNGPAPLSLFPDLAPLGNYGGPTQTMPPLFGSPAINAASVAANTFTNDQRGYPRLIASRMDLGAVEGVYSASASVLTHATWLGNGSSQFGFTNYEDMTFNVFATTNLALPFSLWQNLGYAAGAPAGSGQFLFTDTNALHSPQRFYQVVSP